MYWLGKVSLKSGQGNHLQCRTKSVAYFSGQAWWRQWRTNWNENVAEGNVGKHEQGSGDGGAVVNFCCFALLVPRTKVQQTTKRRRHGFVNMCVYIVFAHRHIGAKNEIGLQSKQKTGPGFGDMAIDILDIRVYMYVHTYRYGCTVFMCSWVEHSKSPRQALEILLFSRGSNEKHSTKIPNSI